ncbi:MAG: hypothetical protein B7Z71_04520 [Acidocella sp. 21-58-7]|nr:MAG: hypothetical protein B7Z71_04520 [Acidocella sp. 21-58-7]
MIENIVFYIVSAILLASAVMVVSSRNPVHSVLFLILAFFNAAVLFLMAGAEFLAMVLVIVYVGAVAVLFMFVVMMLDVDFVALREGVQRYAPVGFAVGIILFVEIAFVAMAILLVSMIGAIVLTLRDRNRGKRQNVTMQHERMPADTMRMVNAKLGEGAVMPPQTEEAL